MNQYQQSEAGRTSVAPATVPDEFWNLLHEWADTGNEERRDAIEHRFGELFALARVAPAEPAKGMTDEGPVAYEFFNPATGHAIVDYARHTHVGHLSAEKGYVAYPLVHALARKPTAWLHTVKQRDGDGTEDQALSFAPDNFPLQGEESGMFYSLGAVPLYATAASIGEREVAGCAPSLPSGMRLVLIEPTPEMLDAVFDRDDESAIPCTRRGLADAYTAMLAASAHPPVSEQGGGSASSRTPLTKDAE